MTVVLRNVLGHACWVRLNVCYLTLDIWIILAATILCRYQKVLRVCLVTTSDLYRRWTQSRKKLKWFLSSSFRVVHSVWSVFDLTFELNFYSKVTVTADVWPLFCKYLLDVLSWYMLVLMKAPQLNKKRAEPHTRLQTILDFGALVRRYKMWLYGLKKWQNNHKSNQIDG